MCTWDHPRAKQLLLLLQNLELFIGNELRLLRRPLLASLTIVEHICDKVHFIPSPVAQQPAQTCNGTRHILTSIQGDWLSVLVETSVCGVKVFAGETEASCGDGVELGEDEKMDLGSKCRERERQIIGDDYMMS